MKKTIIILAIASLAVATACNERVEIPSLTGDKTISLDLVYEGDVETKTAGVGSENTVNSVQYFFYNDTSAAPIFNSGYLTKPTLSSDLKYTATHIAGEGGVPDLATLFANEKLTVFAVFNAAAAITPASLAVVKKDAVNNTFSYEATDGWTVIPEEDPHGRSKSFVMAGELEIPRKTSPSAAVTGTVQMKRLAAKVAVTLVVNSSVTTSSGTWIPMLGGNNVRMYMCNFVQNSVLGSASTTPTLPTSYTQNDYKNYIVKTDGLTASSGKYTIAPQMDFYTYPIEWEAGSDTEPFIKLILPWRQQEGVTSQKELYYKIMFPTSIKSLEANKYYKLTVNVSLLGNEGEPTVDLIAQNARVVGWEDNDKVNPVISAAKYLSVQKENIVFYTASNGTKFAASEDVSAEIVEVKQQNLSTGNWEYIVKEGALQASTRADLGTKSWITDANGLRIGLKVGANEWIKVDNSASYLEVNHTLDKSLTSTHMDVTPWYYTVKLHLGANTTANADTYNDESYIKTVTFVQWPEVYVVEDPNKAAGTWGGTYLNSYRYNAPNLNEDPLGGLHGLTGDNSNPNMYVLTVSVSDSYTIGDPRSTTVDNPSLNNNNWQGTGSGPYDYVTQWVNAPRTYSNTNGRLSNYHPTSGTNTSNMIAPKIRIASSYGVCIVGISEANAIRRCASYQEDGIPAGRWRLPTMAEVQFISTLSSLGRIPYLFGLNSSTQSSDSYYWTANGRIHINNGTKTAEPYTGTGNPNTSVRCVYDEWFWGDASTRPVNADTFTWGDRNY